MSDNIVDINEKIFNLACELHGLEHGDLKALPSYEMIKKFLVDNEWAVKLSTPTHKGGSDE